MIYVRASFLGSRLSKCSSTSKIQYQNYDLFIKKSPRFFCSSCNLLNKAKAKSLDNPARVRFAPSPTGHLHFGGLRTAFINYLVAKKTNGSFILRIEDTDQSRTVTTALVNLVNSLEWAKLSYDEGPGKSGDYGPYIQSERKALYKEHADILLEKEKAYHCFCSSEDLKARREKLREYSAPSTHDPCRNLTQDQVRSKLQQNIPHVIRFKSNVENDRPLLAYDLTYGNLSFPGSSLQEDFVILKSDGMPTYHLASVVDDYLMKITHVIRGEEWVNSIPKHIQLYEAFGWKEPIFIHMPIMLNPDGSKMSKRTGDWQIDTYIDKGYEPEAVLNFVSLLGAHWDSKEVLTLQDMISEFEIGRINRHRASVDLKRLDHLNAQHMLMKEQTPQGRQDLISGIKKGLEIAGLKSELCTNDEYIEKLLPLFSGRLRPTTHDVAREHAYFFVEPNYDTKEAQNLRRKLDSGSYLDAIDWAISVITSNDFTNVQDLTMAFKQESTPVRWKTLRYALSAQKSGPPIAEVVWGLGKQSCLDRLEKAKKL